MVDSLPHITDHPQRLLVGKLPKKFHHRLRYVLVFVNQDVLESVDEFAERNAVGLDGNGRLSDKVNKVDHASLSQRSLVRIVQVSHVYPATLQLLVVGLVLKDVLSVFRRTDKFLLQPGNAGDNGSEPIVRVLDTQVVLELQLRQRCYQR